MKKNILLFVANIMAVNFACSQGTAINSSNAGPDPSAMLDVSSSTQGVLIPRVALTGTTVAAPITNPANSLLVFNTASAGDVIPGFYYWDEAGAVWKPVAGSTGPTCAGAPPTPGPIIGYSNVSANT